MSGIEITEQTPQRAHVLAMAMSADTVEASPPSYVRLVIASCKVRSQLVSLVARRQARSTATKSGQNRHTTPISPRWPGGWKSAVPPALAPCRMPRHPDLARLCSKRSILRGGDKWQPDGQSKGPKKGFESRLRHVNPFKNRKFSGVPEKSGEMRYIRDRSLSLREKFSNCRQHQHPLRCFESCRRPVIS